MEEEEGLRGSKGVEEEEGLRGSRGVEEEVEEGEGEEPKGR